MITRLIIAALNWDWGNSECEENKCSFDPFSFLWFWPWCSGTAWGHQWTATHTGLSEETLAAGSWSTAGTGCCCSAGTWRWGPGPGSTSTATLDSGEEKSYAITQFKGNLEEIYYLSLKSVIWTFFIKSTQKVIH